MNDLARMGQKVQQQERYEKGILAFRHHDEIPAHAQSYGEDVSFLCAITAEIWQENKSFYLTNKNILCGGGIYAGIGTRKLTHEEFQDGMQAFIGENLAYCSMAAFRRVNQQLPHFFRHRKYLEIGPLSQVPDPDVIMIVADANKIMRLCKAYTWQSGELVQGFQGTAWCAQAFPAVYRNRSMTFTLGDPPSRQLMGLDAGDAICTIHASLFPTVVQALDKISSGGFV